MVTFTTAAKVKSTLRKYNTSISDAEIEDFISHAEGLIKAIMRGKFTAVFSSSKHGLIERAATDLAAFDLLNYDPSSFSSVAEASMIGDFLWTSIELDIKLLTDERIIEYLNNAT